MATIQARIEPRVLLHNVRWQTYEMLAADTGESHVRLAYDRGELEIMSPWSEHESYKCLIGRMIEALTEELDIALKSGGSTTFKREDIDRGIEPDACYWIDRELLVRGKVDIDLTVDPPPDLAVEIDLTRSFLNRQAIYAALGVPEVWSFDGHSIRVFQLSEQGEYAQCPSSRAFPLLPMADVVRFVQQGTPDGETSWIKSFRAWVRSEVAPRSKGHTNG
jgi:Uma2 family endonuclease